MDHDPNNVKLHNMFGKLETCSIHGGVIAGIFFPQNTMTFFRIQSFVLATFVDALLASNLFSIKANVQFKSLFWKTISKSMAQLQFEMLIKDHLFEFVVGAVDQD